MGLIVGGIAKGYPTVSQNREYIGAMRDFSEGVKAAAQDALRSTMQVLQVSIQEDIINGQRQAALRGFHGEADLILPYDKGVRQYILPFRPLISGGDDVTFVCDGRIGLSLAVEFVRQFERATKLKACVGVAIVKAHYPFARAYDLAEALCQSAKKLVRVQQQADREAGHPETGYSALDWHFTSGGIYGDLGIMRQREYNIAAPKKKGEPENQQERFWSLTLRPVFIDDDVHPYRTWPVIQRVTTEFQIKWRDHRSKSKRLLQALRRGRGETRAFAARYLFDSGLTLPQVADFDEKFGWRDGFCGYYDGLELMDLFVPLVSGEIENA
jgi:hypothetical protein